MPVTIHLSPAVEEKLGRRATAAGLSLDRYVERLIARDLEEGDRRQANGSPAAAPVGPASSLPSDESLAAFRRQVAESGMSDEELRTLFEGLREEVYEEKHGRPGKAP
ncbi:MAG TPA: hypothetical protein VJ739_15695 [Gemmataceae bacterium]|nr:hypothetical protein [Gemmataceae bacterium]